VLWTSYEIDDTVDSQNKALSIVPALTQPRLLCRHFRWQKNSDAIKDASIGVIAYFADMFLNAIFLQAAKERPYRDIVPFDSCSARSGVSCKMICWQWLYKKRVSPSF
jgi:hypothetical protein